MNVKMRRFFHKFFKIFIIFMVGTAIINIGLLLILVINHKNKSKEEEAFLKIPGEVVRIDDHTMHAIKTGNPDSEITMVFLHNSGIVDDSIALQPLFNELKDDYELVYIDRSGVGYSENSGSSRDIDTMLSETRQVVEALDVNESVVIVPMGTAGIEAIHWANQYPDEVKAIIGINMNYPEQFKDTTTEEYCGFFDYIMMGFAKIGGTRLIESAYPDNNYGLYTDTQMKTRDALISRGFYTKDMYNEDLAMIDNAAKVYAEGWPEDTKMYMILSNPLMEPYASSDEDVSNQYAEAVEENPDVDYVEEYNRTVKDKFKDMDNIMLNEIAGPARVYTYCPKELAEQMSLYIDEQLLQ